MTNIKWMFAIIVIGVAFAAGCVLPDMPAFEEPPAIPADTEDTVDEGGTSQAVPEAVTQAERIEKTGTSFTLAWDPPAEGSVATYSIYYRTRGGADWLFLESIAASSSPSYTVTASIFPAGSYEFGVSSVDSSGNESDIHTSLDDSADPPTGWFLDWDP